MTLNSDIQDSFKKCSLLFCPAEMVFVVVWFLDHFTLETVLSVNGLRIITFVSHLHVWVTKFKLSFMFFQLPVLTWNNIVWVNLSAVLFDEAQHVVKTAAAGYVPVWYNVINLFIEPKHLLLMAFICKLKDLYLIVTACDGLLIFFLHFVCELPSNLWEHQIAAVPSEVLCFWLLT